MTTLEELIENGELTNIDGNLEPGELPYRLLYGVPSFIEWLIQILPNLQTDPIYSEITPIEQVDAIFHSYILGDDIQSDRKFKKLSCTPNHHVWEFKTIDIRMFG